MDLLPDILSAIPELIYVADLETHELLYMNGSGVEKFGSDYKGKKCYALLQQRQTACEFCTNRLLTTDRFYTWDFFNQVVGRNYLLKDRLILWEGRPARIEVAFDTTSLSQKTVEMQNLLNMETLLLDCIAALYKDDDFERNINNSLAIFGDYLEADRVYIFRVDEEKGTMSNTFEWCASGISAEKDNLQDLDSSLIDDWRVDFEKGECHIVYDIERLRDNADPGYEILKMQGIKSLVAAPLQSNGKLIGYIGIDNPPRTKLSGSTAMFPTVSYFISSLITKQAYDERLRQLSYYDALTGLRNRNQFNEDIKAKEYADKLGVVYLDLNGLKDINDQFGHLEGDKALTDLAKRVSQIFGEAYAYRLGGDEFAVICAPIEKSDFDNKVCLLHEIFDLASYQVAAGSAYTFGMRNIYDVIREADGLMYADKKAFYRNHNTSRRYRHHNDIYKDFADSETLTRLLREGRFPLWFQPVFSAETEKIEKVEALVRYIDDAGSVVTPAQFVPDLESAGHINVLDYFVFYRVCKCLTEWLAAGYEPVPVSFNVARKTLVSEKYLETMRDIWNQFQLPKELIEFEITEDMDTNMMHRMLDVIKELRALGFTIAIDDFGSEYANLFLFSSVDFDVLKLDRSLIKNLTKDSKTYSVVRAIMGICHENHVKIVAEGVETETDLAFLKKMDCDYVQGYYFDRPISREQFESKYLRPAEA